MRVWAVHSPTHPELRVANTGAPLSSAGVTALASLRASAKREEPGATGRFGVGFAAVLAVSEEPRVVSTTGGVRFSATATAAEVDRLPGPAAERERRDGRVPALRLVWPVDEDEEPPPDGYATEIRLPLADPGRAAALLDDARADVPDLLLALPGLDVVDVGGQETARIVDPDGTVRIGARRWRTASRAAATGSGRSAEDRDGDATVVWALPVDGPGLDDTETLHAPTATAEQLSLPARLLAPFPLDPDRRRIRPGPRTDALVELAGEAYADLVRATPAQDRAALVPAPGFPRCPLDGRLRGSVAAALAATPWLPGAAGTDLAPQHAEWLDLPGADGVAELLGPADPAFARLLASGPEPPPGLDVARLSPSELTDRLLQVEAAPDWWRTLYDALDGPARTVPGLADELRTLPVPLADGRVVRGPASVLLPESGPRPDPAVTAVAALGLSGLHVAAPEAVHPLLRRLGAGEGDRDALRAHPALRAAVEGSLDDADAGLDVEPLARAVLGLLDGAGTASWAGALALTDDGGAPARADELVLPDAAVRPLLHPDAPVGVLAGHWTDAGRDALVAAGVLDGFAVTTSLDQLDDGESWSDDHPDAAVSGVRDLDLVADDAWPDALQVLAGDRETRAALLAPDGYTSWWLSRNARLGGRRPGYWALPSAPDAAGLIDPVPVTGVDEAVLAAAGVRAGLHVDGPADATDLLDRLADPSRTVAPGTVAAAHRALTDALATGRIEVDDVDPPSRVRAVTGEPVAAESAVVLDAPWALPALDGGVVTGGVPALLAELLDLPLASETVAGEPVDPSSGTVRRWAELAEVAVVCHTLGVRAPDGELVLHERLEVDLTAPRTARIAVLTWPGADGRWHASDPVRALVAALARDGDDRSDPAVAGSAVLGSGRERVEADQGVDAAPPGGGPLSAHIADGAAGNR